MRDFSRDGPNLPLPEEDALRHSEKLVEAIRRRMDEAGGALPFDRFMELALYAPGLGYYVAGARKLGPEGDFVTAPELSPLFSRCLAAQCAEILDFLGNGDILELGAGSGVMAADILLELERRERLPGRYLILEVSPELRQRQQDTLLRRVPHLLCRLTWLDTLPERLDGVVLANEVLDALPIQRFRIEQSGEVQELCVRWSDGDWEEFAANPLSPGLCGAVGALQAKGLAVEPGYQSEINLRLGPWVKALGECLSRGVLLLIDYGYPQAEYYRAYRRAGTLMCHYRHRAHSDPYLWVGLQDITADVDFSAVAAVGAACGFQLSGYTTQAHFLLGCGLDGMLAAIDPTDIGSHLEAVQQAKRLLLPVHMGERFQVLALHKGMAKPLMGFSLRDLQDRLQTHPVSATRSRQHRPGRGR